MGRRLSNATPHAELAGAPPQLATTQDLLGAEPPYESHWHARQRTARRPGAINLKAVADACIEAGLDPAAEIAHALAATRPLIGKDGRQVFDDNGLPVMVPLVDSDTRLRALNELLQYTQPKLKAVEVKVSGSLEVPTEQLDARLAALIAKATK